MRDDDTKPSEDGGRDGLPPVVTPTLAEIYLAQGHTARALAIYRRLLEDDPDRPDLRRKVVTLEHRVERERDEARAVARIERLKALLRRVQRRRKALEMRGDGAA